MFLAHLVGDYVLQWDALAQWKSRELKGVIAHCVIVLIVTALFALPFDPTWWSGILFISVTHFAIDASQLFARRHIELPIPPLLRFIADQIMHTLFILIALVWGGYLTWGNLWGGIAGSIYEAPMLTALLGYAFVTMPAWVLLKFVVYGLVKGQPPDFPAGPNKYVGITERLIITTLVLSGQLLLVPLVALPRLLVETPQVAHTSRALVYVAELLASVALAVGVGLALRQL